MIDYGRGIRARHSVCPRDFAALRAQAFEASELATPALHEADHPLTRKHGLCAVCGRHKDAGLLVCWPCYRKHDFRNGAQGARVDDLIDDAERYLAGDSYGRPENFRK
jgi:hypothetical protein